VLPGAEDQPGWPRQPDADKTGVAERPFADLGGLASVVVVHEHGRRHVVVEQVPAGQQRGDGGRQAFPLPTLTVGEDQVEGARAAGDRHGIAGDEMLPGRPVARGGAGGGGGVDLGLRRPVIIPANTRTCAVTAANRRQRAGPEYLLRNDLIVLDEVVFAPLHDTAAQLLFRVVITAYERRSLGIASHWPFANEAGHCPSTPGPLSEARSPRTANLLSITKALPVPPTWPNSAQMPITQPAQGRILPLGTPLSGRLLIGSAFELPDLPVWSYGDSNPRPLACYGER
jgi:hypothetical protein